MNELRDAPSKEAMILEMADVLEVLEALQKSYGLDLNEILSTKRQNRMESLKRRSFGICDRGVNDDRLYQFVAGHYREHEQREHVQAGLGTRIDRDLYESKDENHDLVIPFVQIAEKMLKYYWNQTYFFNLKQSPGKKPIVVQETEKCIEFVKNIRQSNIPVWFDKAQQDLLSDPNFYQKRINAIAKTLEHDVCWRFKRIKRDHQTSSETSCPAR